MGLDTSHDCWSGAYSAFHRWRTRLAEVSGYGENWPDNMPIHEGEELESIYEGKWSKAPDDPILILLIHSDCDGYIAPEHAKLIADRLEGLLPNLRGNAGGHIGDIKAKTEKFIAGLREAASAGEPVEFH